MKRRTFCVSALATGGAAALPFGRAFAMAATATGEVSAVTGDGRPVALTRSDIEDLRAGLRGQLLLPGATDYDEARKIWNGAFDRRPALIARCVGAADVVRAVSFARTHQLLVAVRGGGHSLPGQSVCDHGLMIDLAPMRSVRVDPARKLARVEPGALLGDLDREALSFGLATTTGTVSHTGAAGLTLGGGFGRIARRFGLTCDNLASVEIVVADGRLLHASETQNADLFWGVRGGGGNFGVVTSFEYVLHPFNPLVYGGVLTYPLEQAGVVLENFAEHQATAPDELWFEPQLETMPTGERLATLDVCYSGPLDAGERVLAPYRRFGKPLRDTVGPTQYTRLQSKDDHRSRHGRRYYTRSGFIKHFDRPLIDALVQGFANAPIERPRIALTTHGGAIRRVAPDATAFWHRDTRFSLIRQTIGDDPGSDAANTQWARTTWSILEPLTQGFYSNTNVTDAVEERIRGAYGGNYERLAALKAKYDPGNLLRLNANFKPRA